MDEQRSSRPALYLSIPHSCSYLPERTASTLFVDPEHPVDSRVYGELNRRGFRRSGAIVYRPHCPDCQACVPVRIPVRDFTPNRSQRRAWERNADLTVTVVEPHFVEEHFALFCRYQASRHSGGGMDRADPDHYWRFLRAHTVDTRLCEIREGRRLVGVAVVDVLRDGLSAMYTFFDPDLPARSLGVYGILWEVAHARSLGLPWVYLGYWIRQSDKMSYKIRYQPLEAYLQGAWVRLQAPDDPRLPD